MSDLISGATWSRWYEASSSRTRYQLAQGNGVDHAKEMVPPAFVEAVDEHLALNLFAAAVALLARLAEDAPAGCVAEEILAVRLIEMAESWLEYEVAKGIIDEQSAAAARPELRGLFELFQDDDVLNLFEMEEPADAALSGHDPIARQLGVADQRIESWFQPFGGLPATGHLDEDDPTQVGDLPDG